MLISRNNDVITCNDDLEHLYTFDKFPVFMGCTDAPQFLDRCENMSFWISKSSGMIQLNPLLPLDVLYPAAHGAGMVGKSWIGHHKELTKFISQYNPESVLEIGGGHGILATNYQLIRKIPWTILEPNPTPIHGCEAKIIKGFFDEDFCLKETPEAVVHSHLFEHIYNPLQFIRNLSRLLSPGKLLIFSVPNMNVMLRRKYTNCLNFEHTIYLSEDYIELLLENNNFSIKEKKYYLDDHSIFYAAERTERSHGRELQAELYTVNKKLYREYITFHRSLICDINRKIESHRNDNIYLFGAHVQSQYLIGFGLATSRVKAILDNDTSKHGKRLYGTDKIVLSPEELRALDSPLIVVRAGAFTSEIVDQITVINPNAKIAL